tara:strand:+ start:1129 stop:2115 length:987 start_codon:yes stop_codon:yes gene_type:complete
MVDIDKQLFSIFGNFIRDLSKTYPEIKSCLYRNYEDCILNEDKSLVDFPKLVRFLELIGDYEKLITDKNLEFFDLEVEFLEEISFKRLWLKNISNKTRESIWKYLQTFQIININLKAGKQLQDALSQIGTDTEMEVDRDTVKELKKLKKLSEGVKSEVKQDESDLDAMLGPLMDSGIGDIAKEVAKSMDLEKMFGSMDENANPMELMSQMMDPTKMGAIFQNINTVMEGKMNSGELTKDGLKGEAEGMMGKMGENPMFKNMMKGFDPSMMADPSKMTDPTDPTKTNKHDKDCAEGCCNQGVPLSITGLTREDKQKKLREKINEKKNNR